MKTIELSDVPKYKIEERTDGVYLLVKLSKYSSTETKLTPEEAIEWKCPQPKTMFSREDWKMIHREAEEIRSRKIKEEQNK